MLLAVLVHFKTYVDIYASFINYAHFSKKKKRAEIPGGGDSLIKVAGLFVVPFGGLNLWIGIAKGAKT